ncbi:MULTISPECIES: helix-turn-helix domain-containing protein [Flavobacterium]|uniref:helix-turn-helix domain-containing protein n=1 Tax=Flavobacterium TaxID=237 RepID=UPI001FCC5CE2|nr:MULTISPECIES: helix-turn-helix domain-containing protein [Flavobacterium]UOK41590.1 helix-turn-helix domain-containing protein [Flavobacterium enshiense]
MKSINHPFQESLKNIESRLEELTNIVSKIQPANTDDKFISNEEFQKLMGISSGTAKNWREQGLILYSQIRGKIYYKMRDVAKLIDTNYSGSKKK